MPQGTIDVRLYNMALYTLTAILLLLEKQGRKDSHCLNIAKVCVRNSESKQA